MACGACSKRRVAQTAARREREEQDLMAGYANLTDKQIKARLELYKRRYCSTCAQRYTCDYQNYIECKKG